MSRQFFRNIIRFLLLVLVQVLVLNEIKLGGYINPYIYVLFIILLPVDISKSLLLTLAFILGLTIDFFGNTLGLHAAATVLMAYARPGTINLFFSNLEFNSNEEPGLQRLKFSGFFRYVFEEETELLDGLKDYMKDMPEVFSFTDFLYTLYRIMLNTLLTMLLIFITVFIFNKKSN